MKYLIVALSLAMSLQTGSALAQECLSLDSGEVLCDDGSYLYYWSPASGQWQILDRQEVAVDADPSDSSIPSSDPNDDGSVAYGDGSSLTTTENGCTMFSAPGYGFGESLSFSSGC